VSKLAVVPSVIETTSHVEPTCAFEFWRSTALARFGDVDPQHPRAPFSAKRLTVAQPDWILTHTVSSPVGLNFRTRHIDRNARDMVVIGVGIDGIGYQQQGERGTQLGGGDVSILSRGLPFVAGTRSAYEEIRLAVPRETIETRIGRVEAFAGGCVGEPSTSAEFRAFMRKLAASVAWMTESEAQVAIDGALHLLGCLVRDTDEPSGTEVSQAMAVSLARAHIVRRMHDPNLDPRAIHVALGISRAQLYRAFAETGGVAAAIRDVRLDLAYRRLTSPRDDKLKVATIAYGCGFTDIPTFNRAFRRRFHLSPRDVRASRA